MTVLIRIALLSSAVAIFVAATIYANSIDARYRAEARTDLLTEALFGSEENRKKDKSDRPAFDVVFLGASRTRRAVMVDPLSRSLAKSLNRPVLIRDLGAPFAGMGVRYIEIRDLLQHRVVNTLVVEYSPAFEQVSDTHPDFFRLATVADILDDPLTAQSLLTRQSQRLSMIARKYAAMVSVAGRRYFSELPPLTSTEDHLTEVWINRESIARSISHARRTGDYLTPTRLMPGTRQAQRTEYYVRKIINLAERNQVKLIFWTIPGALKLDYDDWSKAQFKTRYNYTLFSFSDDLREKLRQQGYADAQHLNRDGALAIQGRVVQLLLDQGGLR